MRKELALMLKFYKATGLGALQHWHHYSIWKAKQQKKAGKKK